MNMVKVKLQPQLTLKMSIWENEMDDAVCRTLLLVGYTVSSILYTYIVGMNLNCHLGEGLNVKGVSKDKELKDTNIETLDVKG